MAKSKYSYLNGIPLVGGTLAKVGKVIEINSFACGAEAEIWVYAFFHELPELFWSIVKPDPIDFAIDKFGLQKGKKSRRRFKAYDKAPRIGIAGKGLGWYAFKLVQIHQRVGWYMLLADLGPDMALRWTSTAYRWGGCKNPFAPYVQTQLIKGQQSASGGPASQGFTAIGAYIFSHGATRLIIPAGYKATITASIEAIPNKDYPNAILAAVWVEETTSGERWYLPKPEPTNAGVYYTRARLPRDIIGPGIRNYRLMVQAQNGVMITTGGTFSAFGEALEPIEPDP